MYSPNQKDILTLFFSQPQWQLYVHEIGKVLGKKPGVFQKALNALEREGILKSERRGNQRVISLNQDYPLLKEVGKIIQKTAGIENLLEKLVSKEPGVEIALIFGSYAKDRMKTVSDIDLLLVSQKDVEDKILERIEAIEGRILREINPKFYTTGEYLQKKKNKDPFLREILSDQYILLKGQP